jgi:hypothetical protein
MCERMDFRVQYAVPSTWVVREMARENHVAIQCFPPPPPSSSSSLAGGGGVHGISLNCFAYHKKVADASPDRLMDTFLKRFAPTCEGGTLHVVRRSSPATTTTSNPAEAAAGNHAGKGEGSAKGNWVDCISSQIGGAVCEITFVPRAGPIGGSAETVGGEATTTAQDCRKAHGLCRAFFNSNKRLHYIMLVVVPDEEYHASERLAAHALLHLAETSATAGSNF